MFNIRHLITQSHLSSPKNKVLIAFIKNNLVRTSSLNYSSKTAQETKTETVNISESCVKRLKELENTKKYLRILVDSGGCSGLEYKFSLDTDITNEDKVVEKDGCKVLIDKETLSFIKGSTIDYYEELIRSGFRIINNPNSEQGCSCGSSFSIKI